MSGLAEVLASYRPADPLEAVHLVEIQQLLLSPGDPGDRSRHRPGHLTASAFVLHPRAEAVVLVNHPTLGVWVQPGGHLEPGDPDPEAAARREVAEEVGLAALAGLGLCDVDVHEIPPRGPEPAHRHFDLRFAFRAEEDDLERGELEARWVPLRRLLTLDESLARPARKLAGLG